MTEIIIFIGIVIPELVLRTNQKYTLVVKKLLGTTRVFSRLVPGLVVTVLPLTAPIKESAEVNNLVEFH